MEHLKRLGLFFLLVMIVCTPKRSFTQGEGDNWNFGNNCAISFTSGNPQFVPGSKLVTSEGCATISDANGNLLFYTDGISVWNRLNDPMPNGNGLLGDPSASQSGVIVPIPEQPSRFYIFTVPSTPSVQVGLNYSIVDLTLDGGFGDIVPGAKNIFIMEPVTEKVTAVKHANNKDIWVITHEWGSNRFFAYKITSAGIDINNPVISSVGSIHDGDIDNVIGYLKPSANGKKLACAITFDNRAEVFDFDPTSGIVSNPIPFSFDVTLDEGPYGIEFSPDNTKLYFSIYNMGYVYQFDLNAGTPAQIQNSKTNIGGSSSLYIGALQLAKDSKIYVTNAFSNNLAAIPNPNNAGLSCGYIPEEVSLGTTEARFGLPTFIQSYFDVCANSNLRFFTIFRKTYTCPDCANGVIAAKGIYGVPPYMYSLDGQNFQNSGVFEGLSPGSYVVTIKDANGCTISRTVVLY